MANLDQILDYQAEHTYSGYGSGVNISSYSSSSNQYTVPSDGIIKISITYAKGNYAYLRVGGLELAQVSSTSASATTGLVGNMGCSTPVFKGQKVYIQSSGTASATFYPFV